MEADIEKKIPEPASLYSEGKERGKGREKDQIFLSAEKKGKKKEGKEIDNQGLERNRGSAFSSERGREGR